MARLGPTCSEGQGQTRFYVALLDNLKTAMQQLLHCCFKLNVAFEGLCCLNCNASKLRRWGRVLTVSK